MSLCTTACVRLWKSERTRTIWLTERGSDWQEHRVCVADSRYCLHYGEPSWIFIWLVNLFYYPHWKNTPSIIKPVWRRYLCRHQICKLGVQSVAQPLALSCDLLKEKNLGSLSLVITQWVHMPAFIGLSYFQGRFWNIWHQLKFSFFPLINF